MPDERIVPFPLSCAEKLLREYLPPEDRIDPDGAWRLKYDHFMFANNIKTGELELRRKPETEGFTLTVNYMMINPLGYRQETRAQMLCRNDALATPLRWQMTACTFSANGSDVPGTRIDKKQDDNTKEATALNWALFEVVQRLPQRAGTLKFTLLDHFDHIKPGQSLQYDRDITLSFGGHPALMTREVRLEKGTVTESYRGYEGASEIHVSTFNQFGQGIIPWTYYVDQKGRTLFAVSGLEFYILREAKANS